jgi:hypothetical protein
VSKILSSGLRSEFYALNVSINFFDLKGIICRNGSRRTVCAPYHSVVPAIEPQQQFVHILFPNGFAGWPFRDGLPTHWTSRYAFASKPRLHHSTITVNSTLSVGARQAGVVL